MMRFSRLPPQEAEHLFSEMRTTLSFVIFQCATVMKVDDSNGMANGMVSQHDHLESLLPGQLIS
jgi:hypothetical protein